MNFFKKYKILSIVVLCVLTVGILLAIVLPLTLKPKNDNGHVHSYEEVIIAPTCTQEGHTTHTCSCGKTFTDSITFALGHSFGDWQTTTPATCTSDGEKTKTCTRSGCNFAETSIITAGHIDANSNGACDRCDLDFGSTEQRTALPTNVGWNNVNITNSTFIGLIDAQANNSNYVSNTNSLLLEGKIEIKLSSVEQSEFETIAQSVYGDVGANKSNVFEDKAYEISGSAETGYLEFSGTYQVSNIWYNVFMRYFVTNENSYLFLGETATAKDLEISITINEGEKNQLTNIANISQKVKNKLLLSEDLDFIKLPTDATLDTENSYYSEGLPQIYIEYSLDNDLEVQESNQYFNELCQKMFDWGANKKYDSSTKTATAVSDINDLKFGTDNLEFSANYGEKETILNGEAYRSVYCNLSGLTISITIEFAN